MSKRRAKTLARLFSFIFGTVEEITVVLVDGEVAFRSAKSALSFVPFRGAKDNVLSDFLIAHRSGTVAMWGACKEVSGCQRSAREAGSRQLPEASVVPVSLSLGARV